MNNYTKDEMTAALREVSSTINKCEKIHGKFAEGTSQHTLLKNRIKAMYISKLLIENELSRRETTQSSEFQIRQVREHYTKEELQLALPPVISIISKCEKAQVKFVEGTSHHTRFKNIISAMHISKALIEKEF